MQTCKVGQILSLRVLGRTREGGRGGSLEEDSRGPKERHFKHFEANQKKNSRSAEDALLGWVLNPGGGGKDTLN
jgi:hypothetical protein